MCHTIGRTYGCFERKTSVVDSTEAIRGVVLKVATYKVRMAFNRHRHSAWNEIRRAENL